jgi:hypothetical protein
VTEYREISLLLYDAGASLKTLLLGPAFVAPSRLPWDNVKNKFKPEGIAHPSGKAALPPGHKVALTQ